MLFIIGIIAGFAGLCLVPGLLNRLFGDKELLAAILSIVVAVALFFSAWVTLTQFSGGVLLVYIGVVLVNICTSSYKHERIDGGRDRRFKAENNPFYEGIFSGGTVLRSMIAMVITFVYHGITSGNWGPLALLSGPFAFFLGFFYGIYDIFIKNVFKIWFQ